MPDILWSDLRMPDGLRPGRNDVVVVDSDVRLIFDTTTPVTIEGLVVYGEFVVADDGDAHALTTDWAVVAGDGTFRVGTADDPYASDFTLTLAGKDNRNTVDLRDYPDGCEEDDGCPVTGGSTCHCGDADGGHSHHVIENNNAFLMAMGDGASIEIHADDASKESWTQLSVTAEAGDTQLRFTERTGWEVGDKIAIASTDFDLNQAEEFEIVAVSNGGRTVTLNAPLEFMHYGAVETYSNGEETFEIDMRAEVALLSRDVTIQGDINYNETLAHNQQRDQYGGHTMVMHGGEMYISGAEFAYMGQAGVLGRYPVHWHLSEDVSGQYIENSSFHHTFNNGITIHGAENARVQNNAVFETVGHGVFLEDGSEIGNQILDNLVFNQRHPGRFQGSPGGNQDEPSSFWIENGENTIRGNHAAGAEDTGFFFHNVSDDVQRPSRSLDSLADNGSNAGPTDMVDNVVHSSNRGFFLNHGSLVQDRNPSGDAAQQQKIAPWEVNDITVYKIDGRGLYVRGVEGVFNDVAMAEVGEGTRFRLNQGIDGGVIVGRSEGNIGTPSTPEEVREGRSLPHGDRNFSGHLLYDGPGGIKDIHFDGFYDEADYAIDLTNAVHKSSLHYSTGLTWGPEATMRWEQRVDFGINSAENQQTSEMLVDLDGSLTGILGGAVLTDEPRSRDAAYGFNRSENAIVIEEWGAVVSPFSDVEFIGLMNVRTVDENGDYRGATSYDVSTFEIDVMRSDGPVVDNLSVGAGTGHRQTPIIDGYTYEMTVRGEPPQFHFWMTDMPEGASVIYQINGLRQDSLFYLKNPNTRAIIDIREVTSMAMLEASPNTAIFRDLATGETHIKFVSEMFYGWDFARPQETRNDALTGGVIVNVDQRNQSRVDLDALPYDDPAGGPIDDPVDENTAPIARNDTVETTPGQSVEADVLANDRDPDGDPLTLSLVRVGEGLEARITDDAMIAVSTSTEYTGTTSILYAVEDGRGGRDTARLNVIVEPAPNQAPTARNDSITLPFNTGRRIDVLANDTDPDGDTLTLGIESVTDGLFAELRNGQIFVRGNSDLNGGTGRVVYSVDDGAGGTDTARLNVTVTSRENAAPRAADDAVSTPMGQRVRVNVDANDTDADGDTLAVTIVEEPEHGAVEVRGNGDIRYTPDPGFSGTDTMTYRVADGFGGQDTATLTVAVEAPDVVTTGPVYLANANGNFVFEAESAIDQDRPGGWDFRTADQLPSGHDAPTGGGYIESTAPNSFSAPRDPDENPEQILTYSFRPDRDGFVQINLVASYIGTDPSEHNDTWTGILKDGVPVPAVSPQGAPNQSKEALEPRGTLELYKTYQSGGSSDDFRVANRNIDNVGRAIVVPVEAGEVYDLVLMERSQGHQVDRIVLTYHEVGNTVGVGSSGNAGPLQAEPLSPVEGADDPVENAPPVAEDDSLALVEGGSARIAVLANDSDPDGDPLSLTDVEAGNGLTAEIVGNDLQIAAEPGFSGTSTVSYTVRDDANATAQGTVTVTVSEAPPALDPNGLAAMADRIVFHFDGNNQDADDIAAIAVAALLAKAGGIESKTTFLYGNNLSEPNDGPARQQAMDGSADFARSLGIASYDYQDGILGTTDLLMDMLRSGEQILLIEGGPMEAVYRALDAVEPQYHSNLTLLSHSEWNEDRAVTTRETDGVEDGQIAARTWDDIAEDFPLVTQIEIADQNGGDHNTSGFYNRNWDWMDETTDPMIAEAREKMMAARNSSIGSQNKQNDPSDAGMLFYALTGEERGTPEDAQAFIEGSTLFSTPATPIATPGPIAAPTPLTVGLFFTDGAGEAAIADLASDGAIDLAELSGRPVTVQASILPGEGPIGSVVIDAGSLGEETDESAPFALAGPASDSGDPGAVPSAGSYPILVTAFSGPDGTGSVVGRQVFTLAVTGEDDDDNGNGDDDNNNDGPIELAIALVNASTDSVIGAIQDGGSLSIANGLADSLSIAAMSDDPRVGSVTLQLGTGPVQIENQAPYALFGDMGGDYEPGTIPLGSNRLTIRTWSGENGQGRLLSEEVLTFDLAIENRPPVAADDSLTLDAGAEERIDVRLNDSDPDGDPLTVTAVSASTGLEASVAENGEVRVASTSEDGGTGRVVYTVEDGRGGSAQAEIAVTVTPPPADDPADDPGPVAIAIALVDAADEAVIEAIEEGETLSVSAEQAAALSIAALVDDPRVNSVTLQLGNGPVQVESHTPYALFGDIGGDYEAGPIPAGRNQLTIAAWSGENGEGAMLATQTIAFTLDVAPPMISNRDPTPMDDALSLAYLGAEIIDPLTNDSDPDQDALTITALTPSQGLTASRVDGGVRVAAVPDFTGPGTVTYRVADGRGGTAEAVIAVTVAEPEAARIGLVLIDAATDTALGPIQQGSVITVPSGSTDALSIEAVTEDGRVESIALQFDDGQVQIENMAPFALFGNTGRDFLPGQIGPGAHNLTVTAFTGDGASGLDLGTTAVLFEIVEEDLPPVLVAASFVLASDAPSRSLRITAAELGLDPEGEALVIDSVADPINGSVMITADRSAFVYIPDPGFAGDETFEFALSEADLAGSARTNGAVTVGVEPPPEEPAAMPDLAFSLHFTDGAQEEVTLLEKGTSIRSSSFENRPITVVATTEDDFEGSITMELVGVTSRVDSTAPFALHADEGDQLMEGMTLDPGVYELAYTAFSEPSAAGSVVGEGSFTFEVASPLFDVAVFSTRFLFSRRSVEVSDGGTLDASQLHSRGTLSVGFVPAEDAPAIGSVELTYEGNVEMQNYVPYAYFGGFGSDFLGGRIFQEGAHEVDVRVFSDRDGQGMLIDSFTFDFSVT